jgi:DNA-binding Lrp family transcriptional regulator
MLNILDVIQFIRRLLILVHNELDELDKRILAKFQNDAGVQYAALAEKVGWPTSTVFNRIKRMFDDGVIKKVIPIIDPSALGLNTTAWLKLGIDLKMDCCQVAEKLSENPNLLEVYEIAGDWDIMAKAKVRDNLDLHDLAKELIAMPEVTRISTIVTLKTVKEDHGLPIQKYLTEEKEDEESNE